MPLSIDEDDVGKRVLFTLSNREREICACIAEGLSNTEILDTLKIGSILTVKNHLYRIYEKIGVNTRLQLCVYVYRHPALLIALPTAYIQCAWAEAQRKVIS